MIRFIDLFELYGFAPHLIVVSLDIPYSRKSSNQIGKPYFSGTANSNWSIWYYTISPNSNREKSYDDIRNEE